MNIQITEQAYAAFAGRERGTAAGRKSTQAKLQACADNAGVAFIQWQGSPALFALDAYWRYETHEDVVTLTECVGVFHIVSVSRWERTDRQPIRSSR